MHWSLLAVGVALFAFSLALGSVSAADKVVGYYEMGTEQGDPNQVAAITASGNTAVQLFDLTAGDLDGIDVLVIDNPSNGSYGAEFLANLDAIADWVAAGGVMIFHDRYVTPAETVLPGGSGFDIVRETSGDTADIDVIDDTTLVTDGPGGIVDNSTLDGGNLSSHGFAVLGTLPGDGQFILSRSDPTEIVTFGYCHEDGGVIYSSIPLDFYLGGSNNFSDIYAPNIVAFGTDDEDFACTDGVRAEQPSRPRRNVAGGVGNLPQLSQAAQANRERAAAAAAPVIAPPSTGTGVTISPPSTGDGGLVRSQSGLVSNGTLLVLAAGTAGLGLSALRVVNRRR